MWELNIINCKNPHGHTFMWISGKRKNYKCISCGSGLRKYQNTIGGKGV